MQKEQTPLELFMFMIAYFVLQRKFSFGLEFKDDIKFFSPSRGDWRLVIFQLSY